MCFNVNNCLIKPKKQSKKNKALIEFKSKHLNKNLKDTDKSFYDRIFEDLY